MPQSVVRASDQPATGYRSRCHDATESPPVDVPPADAGGNHRSFYCSLAGVLRELIEPVHVRTLRVTAETAFAQRM
jgi:hypothetical protein